MKRISLAGSKRISVIFKTILSVVLSLCVVMPGILGILSIKADAASYNGSSIVSNNIHDHAYTDNASVSNSYLIPNADGSVTRVENFGDIILVEQYSSSFTLLWQATVGFELSMFGGFYAGEDYYYLVFGQPNYNQDNSVEVIRIVQYTKDWQRVRAYGVYGSNTYYPFYGTNSDFAENGNNVYYRCGHLTYMDSNGMCTQGAMTILIDESTGKVKDVQNTVNGSSYGAVSNIGATFIDASYGTLTAVDHSLYNPYGLVAMAYSYKSTGESFQSTAQYMNLLGSTDGISGAVPGVTIGGYETSSQYFLMAVATSPMDGTSANKNVAIVAVPRSDFSKSSATISYLTGFAQGDAMTCETPYIVKVSSTKYCVLWEQRDGYSDTEKVYYVFIDGQGQRLSDVLSINACLSDCQPVYCGGKIIWYTGNGAVTKFYSVSATGTSTSTGTTGVYNTSSAVYNGIDYSPVFDFAYYCSKYPDIRVLYGNDPAAALVHFVTYGMASGRQASANFNVYIYRTNYSDLREQYGNNLTLYYLHFIKYGNAEGRNARSYL